VNPTLAFPLPVMLHDGDERIKAGVAVSWQVVSLVNPVADPETIVPTCPSVGVSVRVPSGPADTVKVALAESPDPMFVVAVTV